MTKRARSPVAWWAGLLAVGCLTLALPPASTNAQEAATPPSDEEPYDPSSYDQTYDPSFDDLPAAVPVEDSGGYSGGAGAGVPGVDDESFFLVAALIGGLVILTAVFFLLRRGGRKPRAPAAAPEKSSARAPSPKAASTDVFISYKRDERPQVAGIAQRLAALKLGVWFDAEIRSGTTFDAEIDRKVRAAKCVLVCWSPGAVASDWVRGEATIGRSRGVLCAALLQPCDLPAPFNLVHTNDLISGIGPTNPEWMAVLDSIGALVNRPGLADYERLEGSRDAAAYGAWIARYPHDPLANDAIARLKKL